MTYRNLIVVIGLILFSISTAHAAVYTLTPHISISEEYTDNRNQTKTNTIEEYTTTISPGIDQSINAKHLGMTINYSASYVQFNETDSDPIWNHKAALSLWADLSKHTKLSISDFFLRNDQPIRDYSYNLLGYVQIGDQLIPVYDTSLRKGRKQYDSNSTLFSLSHQFGERDTIRFHYSYNFLNELEKGENNNYRLNKPGFNLTYWLTPRFGVDISADYSMGEYGESSEYNEGKGSLALRRLITKHLNMYLSYEYSIYRHDIATYRDYDLHKPSIGISYEIEKDISLTLGAGYYYQDREGKDDEGPFADLSIQRTWSYKRGQISLIGLAGLDSNELGTDNLELRRYYGVAIDASYSFTKHFEAGTNVAFHRNENLNTENGQTDNIGQVGCHLTLTPWRWISIMASYSHSFRSSTLEENDYDENTARLTISIHPWTYRN